MQLRIITNIKLIKRFQFRYEETKEKVDELINLLNKYVEDKAKD